MTSELAKLGEAPTIVFQQQCKICRLAKSYPELFREIHTQVLEVGMSYSRAMNWLNEQVERHNLPINKFNAENMNSHFSTHIALSDRVADELTRHIENPTRVGLDQVNPSANEFVEDIIRKKVGNDVNDYLNLDYLRSQMTEKLDLLDKMIEKDTGTGQSVVDMEAMQMYTKLVSEIRSCIVDLNKIRQSRRLINVVIKSLIEKFTFNVVRQIVAELDKSQDDMVYNGIEEVRAARMTQQLKLIVAEIIATTAKNAVDDIIKSYKLQT